MFEKLVVSTAQKRKRRTTTFFICTSIVYLSTIAIAFAVSVLVEDPKLADTSESIVHVFGLPPAPRGPQVTAHHPSSVGTPRQDITNVLPLDAITNRPHSGPPQIPIPAGTGFSPNDGVAGGDSNGVPGVIGVPGSDTRTEQPPRPADPPRPQPPATTDKRPLLITSNVLQGKAIERTKPSYPLLARQIHLQGDVSVEVIISPEGRVESARVVSGHPMFAEVARNAALSWRFQPTFLNGVAVRVTGVIVFVFKLGE